MSCLIIINDFECQFFKYFFCILLCFASQTDKLGKKRWKLLPITRRLTTGVVNGVLSVRDRYSRRYGRPLTGPDRQELLQRPSTEQLAEVHRLQLPTEEADAIIAQLESIRFDEGERNQQEDEAEEEEEREESAALDVK